MPLAEKPDRKNKIDHWAALSRRSRLAQMACRLPYRL
jgi:hypothetical protein